jgi:phosphopantothenoylcysteine decarboxylase / phosphopantothenate---cysteine ligase
MSQTRSRRRVALVVTGSIAAYKAPMVARALLAAGIDVVPLMTRSAHQFLGPATLSGLTGHAVDSEIFDGEGGERHVDLAASVDAIVVVPATADFLARMASGRADDLATATLLSARVPVWVAPAMHPAMWSHPATVANAATLAARNVRFLGPVLGPVASGEIGLGRMAEPDAIARAVTSALSLAPSLAGRHVVVSAGPTVEDLDPVRFLSNRSTGKMGFAVAAAAADRGARVTLVAGPVTLETPRGVDRVDVRSALSMQAALDRALGPDLTGADALVMSAAVGDYRFAETADHKLKRTGAALTLTLVPNPDLLAELGARRQGARPVLVGFAVETGADDAIVQEGRRKLEAKRVDLVVANPAAESFGRDDNRAFLVSRDTVVAVGTVEKSALAGAILDRVEALLERA